MSKKINTLKTIGFIAGATVSVGCLGVAGYAITDGAIQLPTATETPTPTPPQSVSTVVTDTAITVAPVENAEYSLDGKEWQDSNIFLGLQPAQEYTVYIRIKATEDTPASEPTQVTVQTHKSAQAAPQINAPEATADSIIFAEIEGLEYSINNGETWQSENIFTSLSPAQEYTVLVRYAETATQYASDTVSFQITTQKYEQEMPTEQTNSNYCEPTRITVGAIEGAEYSIDGINYQESNVFENLEVNTEYLFYIRYPETATHYASEPFTIYISTVKYSQSIPDVSDAESTSPTSITMPVIENVEYSIDGIEYSSNNVFTDLQPNEWYNIYARYAEDATHYAGEAVLISVQTPKYQQDAPVLSISSRTIDTVTVAPVENAVYSINNGDSWQSDNVFENIEYGVDYTILAKLPETDTASESPVSSMNYTVESGIYTDANFQSWDTLNFKVNDGILQKIYGTYTNSTIVVDDSVTKMVYGCFQGHKMKGVYLPNTITELSADCFSGCSNLKNIKLPSGIISIPSNCFMDCTSLTAIELPNSVTTLEFGCFQNCVSLNIDIPSNITQIKDQAFMNTALTTVNISANTQISIPSASGSPFAGCKLLQNINVAEGNTSVKSIYGVLFSVDESNLIQMPSGREGSYVIPDATRNICSYAFAYSKLSHIILNQVNSIDISGFVQCENLTSLDLPESLSSLRKTAIGDLPSLETLIIRSSSINFTYQTGATIVGNLPKLQSIYVPDEIVETAKTQLSSFANKIKPLSEYVAE